MRQRHFSLVPKRESAVCPAIESDWLLSRGGRRCGPASTAAASAPRAGRTGLQPTTCARRQGQTQHQQRPPATPPCRQQGPQCMDKSHDHHQRHHQVLPQHGLRLPTTTWCGRSQRLRHKPTQTDTPPSESGSARSWSHGGPQPTSTNTEARRQTKPAASRP